MLAIAARLTYGQECLVGSDNSSPQWPPFTPKVVLCVQLIYPSSEALHKVSN